MKRFSFLFTLFILLLAGTAGCSSSSSSAQEEKKTITIGATAGPYSDQIREAIQPYLEKSSMSNFCSPPGHENPPFLPIMKNRRKQFNRTLCLMVA